MCLPYSLTQYSCRQYIQDHIEEEWKEKKRSLKGVPYYKDPRFNARS